jgi:hypothetical protein
VKSTDIERTEQVAKRCALAHHILDIDNNKAEAPELAPVECMEKFFCKLCKDKAGTFLKSRYVHNYSQHVRTVSVLEDLALFGLSD